MFLFFTLGFIGSIRRLRYMPRLTLADTLIIPVILHNLITALSYIVSKKITINTPLHKTQFDIAPENHTFRAQTNSTGGPHKLWEDIIR